MRALVLRAPGEVELAEVADPRPGDAALVRVLTAGVCGTDLKVIDGSVRVEHPRILGHEAVGEVVVAGSSGRHAVGDRVLVDPAVTCGSCTPCLTDLPHLCAQGGLLGRDVDGCFADLISVDESRLHTVPGAIDPAVGPLLQVLGTCVHAQTLVEPLPEGPAVVVGLGVSGLLHLQLLRARGVTTIVGLTRSASGRRLAERLGATVTAHPADAARVVAEATGDRGAPLVVETSGVPDGVQTALDAAAPAGTILQFGTISDRGHDLDLYPLYLKELRVIGARSARPRDLARAIDHVAAGDVSLEPLAGQRFDAGDHGAAIERSRTAGALKVTLAFGA